jgi:hypothetical protein
VLRFLWIKRFPSHTSHLFSIFSLSLDTENPTIAQSALQKSRGDAKHKSASPTTLHIKKYNGLRRAAQIPYLQNPRGFAVPA